MSKINEAEKVDRQISRLLDNAHLSLEYQGTSIKEIDDALQGRNKDKFGASKKKNGKYGSPDYVGICKDFIIVIEDKDSSNTSFSNDLRDENNVLRDDAEAIEKGAMNGALWYAKHLIKYTSYKKAIAIGVYGNDKQLKISPIYVDDSHTYIELDTVESFISFNEDNINEYYLREILKEDTDIEKDTKQILADAKELHEALYKYGNIQSKDKPLIVSGILLALMGIEDKYFNIDDLNGNTKKTDGIRICEAIKDVLDASNIAPETKKDKLLSQFDIIKNTQIINDINPTLKKTPLKYYTEFLYDKIFKSIRYNSSTEDYLGRFYGEFMSYGDSDGQTLGIVLTPKHITELFCDLLEIKKEDVVLDPTCGTGGFLIAAMHNEFQQVIQEKGLKTRKEIELDEDIDEIRKNNLHGFESQPYMFTIATTNMILRGDGKSNLKNADFLAQNPAQIRKDVKPTVGMMNPPYSQGSKENPNSYEISFIRHLLNCMIKEGKVAVIVPISTMTGKSKEEQNIKDDILLHHTLEGVITLNTNTFYGVGTNAVIAIFTAGIPHPKNKEVKFIDFKNDGYVVSPHIGLLETDSAKDKKQHLLEVWFDRTTVYDTKFCVKSTITSEDEWLHSFYYFNDEIPKDEDFDKTIGDYLSFQFSMVMKGKRHLFEKESTYEIEILLTDGKKLNLKHIAFNKKEVRQYILENYENLDEIIKIEKKER